MRVSTRIEAYSCKAINREKRLFKTLEQDIKSDLELSTSISPPDQHSANLQSAFGPLNQSASRKTMWLLIATLNLAFPDHDFSRVSPEEFIKEDSARSVLNSLTGALSNLRAASNSAGNVASQLGGADAAFRASLFASYPPPSMSSLPGYNPLVPSGRGRRSKLAAEKYGSSAPASASTVAGRKSKDSKAAKKIFASPKRGKAGSSAYINKLKNDLDGSADPAAHPFLRQVLEPIIELGECEVYSYTPDLESDPHAYNSEDEDDEFGSDDEESEALASYDDMEMMEMDGNDEIGWEMDGVDSSYSSTPVGSIPPTPSGRPRTSRKLHDRSYMQPAFPNSMALWDEDGVRTAFDQSGNDDDAGGLLWSSNYFLYNKKMRRILFISCWGRKIGGSPVPMTMALPPVQHIQPLQYTRASTKSPKVPIPPLPPVEQADAPSASEQEVRAPSILSSFQPSKETASLIFGGDLPPTVRESSPVVRGTVVNAAPVSHLASLRDRSTDLNNAQIHSTSTSTPKRGERKRLSSSNGSAGRARRRRKSARRGAA